MSIIESRVRQMSWKFKVKDKKEWIPREHRETICQYFRSYSDIFYYSMNFYHLHTNEMLGTKIRYTRKFKIKGLFFKNTGGDSVENNTKGYKKRNHITLQIKICMPFKH